MENGKTIYSAVVVDHLGRLHVCLQHESLRSFAIVSYFVCPYEPIHSVSQN